MPVRDRRTVRTPRPPGRRAQIIAVAAELFARYGYENVGTGQIADAVGVTAGALYRHFDSKQALLADAIIDSFDRAMEVIAAHPSGDLRAVIDGIAETAAARRDLGVLWNREARALDPPNRARLRERFFGFVSSLQAAVEAARPDLTSEDADLLTWSALASLTSASYHSTDVDRRQLANLLGELTFRVCSVELPPGHGAAAMPITSATSGIAPGSRRQALLSVAPALFAERGYQAVSMSDLGAAVGITNAGVYRHFTSKADVLDAVITRASEALQLGLARALTSADGPADGLDRVLAAYADFALAHVDLVGVLVAEVVNLPDDRRAAIVRAEREFVGEWVRLLRAAQPRLSDVDSRVRVHAALAIVNDVARTRHLRESPGIADRLHAVARAAYC